MPSTFLPYEEPTTVQLLILGSFLLLLPASQRLFQRILSAGILGPLALGVIYGAPLANLLPRVWQEAYLALGYLGIILIVFEGGLSTRLDLLKKNLSLSLTCALTGICCPIALSFTLLTPGYEYPLVESFILGAALSATSLGTTFAILGSLGGTRVGTIAMSAAMIDDVVGLIMASIVTSLNPTSTSNDLRWSIGRPIMAAGLLTVLVPTLVKFVIRHPYARFLAPRLVSRPSHWRMIIMVLTLGGLCSGAAYAGTSILYGAYLAGVVLAHLDAHASKMIIPAVGSALAQDRPSHNGDTITYVTTFHATIGPLQTGFLGPLFFASIGFAIPFRSAWQGTVVWRGLVYTFLMLIGKIIVGGWLPIWTNGPRVHRSVVAGIRLLLPCSSSSPDASTPESSPEHSNHPGSKANASTTPALLLGCMMVARGEIGLLILQLGYIQSGHVSDQGFLVGTWAVVLNTLIGPIVVGILTRRYGESIVQGEWGNVPGDGQGEAEANNTPACDTQNLVLRTAT